MANQAKISIEEMKCIELEIVKNIADFCDKNGLTYYLAYGSLIGAVRHGGFIPWDDDMDIWLPRKDYNKLIEEFNIQMQDTPYIAIDPYHNESQHSFVKIGDKRTIKYEPEYKYKNGGGYIDVDVFPLDGVPEDEKTHLAWCEKLQKNYNAFFYQRLVLKTRPLKQRIRIIIKKILWGCYGSKMCFYKNSLKLHEQYNYEDSKYVGAIECPWTSYKNRLNKEWFSEPKKVKFENYEFNIPQNPHEILTKLYGDYMTLPPEEERVSWHNHEIYWR